MAKITQLPLEETPDGSETVVLVKGGATRRAPFGSLVAAQVAPLRAINMFPDPLLALSAGNIDYAPEGFRVLRPGVANMTWDATFKHPYGKGAWTYNPSSTAFSGFQMHFGGPGTREFQLQAADVISLAVEIIAASGRANIAARFFSAIGGTAYTWVGNQVVGSVNVVQDGTTKVMKVESLTIPAGAVGVAFYLYDTDAYPCAFAPLRVWAVRGAGAGDAPPVRGTEWEKAERARIAVGDTYWAEVEWSVGPTLIYDAAANVLPTTNRSDGSVNALIKGWATALSPAGVSFNAVRVYGLRAASETPLEGCGVVVRKAEANSVQNAGTTVVAVGTVAFPPSDQPQNAMIVLRHPTTGALITLSDVDLNAAEYGVMIYGIDGGGNRAPLVQPVGETSNQLGRTYYVSTGVPATGVWLPQTGNRPVGVEHVFLDGLREGYGPTDKFVQQVAEKIGGGSPPNPLQEIPLLVTPPAVYAVVGKEMNVYFDNLLAVNSDAYLFDATAVGSDSTHLDECWRWTPIAARTTGEAVARVCRKFDGEQLTSGRMLMRAAAADAGDGKTVKVLCIGASHTQSGTITQTLLDLAAADVMGVELLGTRGTGANKHEGRGGWRVDDYATAGRTYYAFTVSGVTTPSAINSTEYSNNGSVYRVQEVALSDGAGTILCSRTGSATPDASGTLTKTNGSAGDAAITFSASAPQSGNPFWHDGNVSFAEYLEVNEIDAPDWAFILLGTNDVFNSTSDSAVASTVATAMAQYETLIASIQEANSSTRVGVTLIPPPSAEQNAFGANYGTGQPHWRAKRNFALWNAALIAKFGGKEADGIYIVPVGPAVDTVNNYPRAAAAPINARNTAVTIARQNNGVHPAVSGYQQMADTLFAAMKYFADA